MGNRLTLREVRRRRGRDLFLIAVSIYAAVMLAEIGVIEGWIEGVAEYAFAGSFVAGIFFTSLFTIAPSIVAFAEISREAPFFLVATSGALGALCGDLILYFFVRDAIVEDFRTAIKPSWRKKMLMFIRHPLLQWVVPAVGAIIIASPLPDELGIALLGVSRVRLGVLIPISFVMNFLGIALIWIGTHGIGT